MEKMKIGPCPICKVKIFEFKMPPFISWDEHGGRINWKKRPVDMNERGAHFWVLQTDSSRMAIAICKVCLKSLDDQKVKKIFADITYTKLSQIEGNEPKDYKLYDRIRTLEVWKWFLTEDEVVDYLDNICKKISS